MEITLTPEIEASLVQRARQLGISPQDLALQSLRRQFAASPIEAAEEGAEEGGEGAVRGAVEGSQTLADFLGDAIGSLDSGELIQGGARMSSLQGWMTDCFTAVIARVNLVLANGSSC